MADKEHPMTDYDALCERLDERAGDWHINHGEIGAADCAQAAAAIRELLKERDDFHIDYRMKCDVETKRLHVEIERLRGLQDLYVQACEQRDDALALLTKVGLRKSCEGTQPYICHGLAMARSEVERLRGLLTPTDEVRDDGGRECGACGHWIPPGGSASCSLDHQPPEVQKCHEVKP
jgi:hypothetical protein